MLAALEDWHCPLYAFLPHGVSASGQSPETHEFLIPSNANFFFKFRCVLSWLKRDGQNGEGRMSGNLIRPLSTSETQQDFSAFSCAPRFITVGVLLSTTANHKRQQKGIKKTMTTSRREASQAGKDLRNPNTPKRDRGPIASDLAQAKRKPKK